MAKLVLKTASVVSAISIFVVPIFANTKLANGSNSSNNNKILWSESKAQESQRYVQSLEKIRNEKLCDVLGLENVDRYMKDMNSLYELSLNLNKVDEVEKIMTQHEKDQVFYEILLVTGDEELAKKYRDDSELYFKFERVVQ